jgi:hypothetical protein
VTYANNNSLIKKYEVNYGESDQLDEETPEDKTPVPPVRGKIKSK